jgi:hypothetical protein
MKRLPEAFVHRVEHPGALHASPPAVFNRHALENDLLEEA